MKHVNVNKKARIFVVMAVVAVLLWSPAGDNLQDIWESPSRIETIEADINEINERLSVMELDEDRIITSASE